VFPRSGKAKVDLKRLRAYLTDAKARAANKDYTMAPLEVDDMDHGAHELQ